MTKKPKTTKPEPFRFNQMTKAELVKTIKTLSARETKHLNRIAKLEAQLATVPNAPLGPALVLDLIPTVYSGCDPHGTAIADLASELGVVHVTQQPGGFGESRTMSQDELPSTINEAALETVEIEIKDPAEQTGLKIPAKPLANPFDFDKGDK